MVRDNDKGDQMHGSDHFLITGILQTLAAGWKADVQDSATYGRLEVELANPW